MRSRVLALCVVVTATIVPACSKKNSSDPVVEVSTTATVANDETDTVIISTWEGFWEAYRPILLEGSETPDMSPLRPYTTQHMYDFIYVNTTLDAKSGVVTLAVDGKTSEAISEPQVRVAGSTASLEVCWIDYAEQFDAAGKQVSPPGTEQRLYIGSFILDADGVWKLDEITTSTC